VPFVRAKKKKRVRGTVPDYLQQNGFEISAKARITPAMRQKLSQRGHFASYSYHPMMGGYAALVKPDGSQMETRKSDDVFSITPEEKSLLNRRSGTNRP
jgi:hypothetical protein